MKIALFNESFPPLIDGVNIVVQNYCKELKKMGDTPIAVVPHMKNETNNFDYEVMRFNSFNIVKSFGYPIGNPVPLSLIRKLISEKPDILHAHSPFVASLIARQVRKKRRVPYVMTYHTRFEREFDSHLKNKMFRNVSEKFLVNNLSATDELWVVSEGCADSLRRVGYTGKYHVMHNGTDFEKGVADSYDVTELRREYKVSDNEILFLYVGRVEWYKNIRMSIDALYQLKQDGVKFKFLVVGKGLGVENIKKYVAERGMNEIIFTGPVYDREKLRVFYSAADLFLFPSTFDTAGLVVMEAAACNCPSLLVRGSCAAEIAVEGQNAYMCDENATGVYNGIREALSDLDRLHNMGIIASEELYYPFSDAVRDARDRYQYLIEKMNKK